MLARTPRVAVDAFLERVSRATVCVAQQPVSATSSQPSEGIGSISFVPFDRPARIRDRHGALLLLSFRYDYLIRSVDVGRDRYEVAVAGYNFRIADVDDREIIAFHWHPVGTSPVIYPHLHLTSRVRSFELPVQRRIALAEMHIPTGFVTLADVVRLLITEFEVEPRRTNWTEILEADWPVSPGIG